MMSIKYSHSIWTWDDTAAMVACLEVYSSKADRLREKAKDASLMHEVLSDFNNKVC